MKLPGTDSLTIEYNYISFFNTIFIAPGYMSSEANATVQPGEFPGDNMAFPTTLLDVLRSQTAVDCDTLDVDSKPCSTHNSEATLVFI